MAIEIVDLPTKNGDVPYVMWLFTQGYRHFHRDPGIRYRLLRGAIHPPAPWRQSIFTAPQLVDLSLRDSELSHIYIIMNIIIIVIIIIVIYIYIYILII